MSSRAEGFPLVLLEAASCGLPVISFDCPSGPNEIVEDGYNGFLISKVGDVKSLASRIESLIEDEAMRRRLGDNALKTTERFSVTNIITEWIRLFEAVN